MNFYTSDTHFSSERTLTFSKRPFLNVSDMDIHIKNQWNSKIKNEDTVYHLGDFGDYNYIKNLNGKVILIMGNYEEKDMKDKFNNDFNLFRKYLINLGFYDVIKHSMVINLNYNGKETSFYLCHKPEDCNKRGLNLFGHIHRLQMVKKYGLNVGTDAHHFYPLNEDDIRFYIEAIEKHYDNNVFE